MAGLRHPIDITFIRLNHECRTRRRNMRKHLLSRFITPLLLTTLFSSPANPQTNPLWHTPKIKNYLPHMTWPEVDDLLSRTDMVIIVVPALEQHGPQLPIGTDYFIGEELAKLIAQKTDVLVAPILLPGISPYHTEFPGTITLSADTVQRVYFEAAQSLIHHGFRKFLILPSHAGNQNVARYILDRINQETPGTAVELGEAAAPFLQEPNKSTDKPEGKPESKPEDKPAQSAQFDRHAGVGETSDGLYLFPTLVDMSKAGKTELTFPDDLQEILPQVVSGDPTAARVFFAEALKPKDTGKHTSTREMTKTGVWSEQDTRQATAEQGRQNMQAFVDAAVQFIEKWKSLQPPKPLSQRRSY
jgi:creatinine amidohydrolase